MPVMGDMPAIPEVPILTAAYVRLSHWAAGRAECMDYSVRCRSRLAIVSEKLAFYHHHLLRLVWAIMEPEIHERKLPPWQVLFFAGLLISTSSTVGCAGHFGEWMHNGFKVGPNYMRPAAQVADD